MSTPANKTLSIELDWAKIEKSVTDSLRSDGALQETLDESYVAEPKTYSQVTEFVSQKTKEAHVALYQQHVEVLNRVSAELDTASRGEANPNHSAFRNLKLDETANLNAVWLHELYFANCFDPHSEIYMDSAAYIEFERTWGTFEDFQKDIMACAMSSDDGWAICGYNMFLKRFVNTFVNDDSEDLMLGLYPVLVIDMHEHAMFKDYLTDRKSYLVAMMRELNWTVIEERVNRVKNIAQALK
jgi:Fe-Mn family superoxide dismutase